MFNLKGFMGICALLLVSTTAFAQIQIVIDNQTIPTEHIESIVILPNTNLISVTTTVAYDITPTTVGDGVAITSFAASPLSVDAGANATLSWNTANAVSCTASGGADGWSGSTIALPTGSKIITASTLGSHVFTLTCEGSAAGDTVSKNVTLTVVNPDAVAITSLSANPVSLFEGETTTISWATSNATSCTPSNGTGGWSSVDINAAGLASGSTVINAPTAGTYQFTLTCEDGVGGTDTMSTSVTVDSVDSCGTPSLTGSVVSWSNHWGTAFPGPTYKTVDFTVLKSRYHAIEFNTGNVVDDGRLLAIETTSRSGVILGAISECPGDFDVAPECDYSWGLGGSIDWSTNNLFRSCKLENNKTYYFNVTFTNGVDADTSSCNFNSCVMAFQHRNY